MLRAAFLKEFQCLGAECEDTCCKGWGMQLTRETVSLYQEKAPELLEAVDHGESEFIMRRDPQTDYCVKFDRGLCSVHRDYGTAFLGDACHFYPRITRQLGGQALMTAALSCPEATRLALFTETGFGWEEIPDERLPHSLKEYLPPELTAEEALALHRNFILLAQNPAMSAERSMACVSSVARSLEMLSIHDWSAASGFYFKMAEGRLLTPEPAIADPFNLLHTLNMLLSAAKTTPRPRLEATLNSIAHALCVVMQRQPASIETTDGSLPAWEQMHACYRQLWHDDLQPILKRWLAAQLSMSLFPFSGFGATFSERVTTLGVRFATVKLALIACAHVHGGVPPQSESVRVVQSLSRFLDHLADPTLSLDLYRQTGWTREARLRALIGDIS